MTFDDQRVLLVVGRSQFTARNHKPTLRINDLRHLAGNRCTVHVHIENVQENADTSLSVPEISNRYHLPVGGRDHHITFRRDALWVTKEVKAKGSQNVKWRACPRR